MCVGICYKASERLTIVHFADAQAQLPVQMKNKTVALFPWGRRKHETGRLPLGGWLSALAAFN